MGVHGLWELLSPVGHRVSNENVRNKILAVDVSIWLTQFVIAMRDPEGAKVRNAHLLGVFRRCIKLLFLSVKPVLVFDGATPAIKRRTLASRRAQREKHEAKVRRLAEKILVTHIKKHAIGRAIAGKKRSIKNTEREDSEEVNNREHAPNVPADAEMTQTGTNEMTPATIEEDEIQPIYSSKDDPVKSRKKFGVSALSDKSSDQNQTESGGEVAGREPTNLELDDESESGYIVLPNDLQDIDHEALVHLPAHVQSEVFKQVKYEQRQRHREEMIRKQNNPTEFSKTQIEGFLRRTALNRQISSARNVLNQNSGVNNRIASDSRREFVFEEKEELNNTERDLEFSDSDDDVIATSFERNRSERGANDIMSRIRAAKGQALASKITASHTTRDEQRKQKELKSGVGWASKVLSGHGGLRLGAPLPGTGLSLSNDLSHSSDEHEDAGSENDGPDDQVQTREVLQKESVPQANVRDMKNNGNESDSDDIEWEDGAVQSDLEDLERDFSVLPNRLQSTRELAEEPLTHASIADVIQPKPGTKPVIREIPSFNDLQSLSREEVLDRKENFQSEPRGDYHSPSEESRTKRRFNSMDSHPIESGVTSFARTTARDGASSKNQSAERNTSLSHGARDEVYDFNENIPKGYAMERNGEEFAADSASRDPRRETVAEDALVKERQSEVYRCDHGMVPRTESAKKDVTLTEVVSSRKTRAEEEEQRDIELAVALSKARKDHTSTETETKNHDHQDVVDPERTQVGNNSPEPLIASIREDIEVDLEADNDELKSVAIDPSEHVDSNEAARKEQVINSSEQRAGEASREISLQEMESLQVELEKETQRMRRQQMSHIGATERISDEMCSETRDLLKLFGIPYLEAPMEAEAQCAFLNIEKIVDGIITEDSDAFLFGAHTVYRKLFADGRFAEVYETKDIKSSLGLDRKQLIRLAYLLGSDYTPGVRGVGIVNAMEILEAFPGINGLNEFLEWTKKVTILDKEPDESVMVGTSEDAVRRRFCWKHRNMKRNWEIREGFPNPVVAEAYLKPTVDESRARFTWRPVDFEGLARFCWEKFGWEQSSFESAVGPLKTQLQLRRGVQQTRIDEFFKPHRFAKIRSERLQQAVKGIAGEQAEELMAATIARRVKRRRTAAVTYQNSSDFTAEEEEEMLKLIERADGKTET